MYLLLILSFLTTLLGNHLLIKYRNGVGVFAVPNERTLHEIPTPRTGGVAIISSIILYSFLLYPVAQIDNTFLLIFSGLVLVAFISFIDDIYTISPVKRLIIHILAALLLIKAGLKIDDIMFAGYMVSLPDIFGTVITILSIIWLINLYNFMDGIDGIAAGMAVFGFSTFAVLAYMSGNTDFMAICLVIACASAGFLIFNFPPAKIFMGDVGASSLGFLVIAMALWADKENIFPIVVSIIVFSPFIIDATVTIVMRTIRKEKIWKAHNTHYYQRLVKIGFGHNKTVLLEYGFMFISSSIAISYFLADNVEQKYILAAYVTIYSGLIYLVHRITVDKCD